MKPASQFFSEDERRTIAAVVAEAERQTSGEIVPVLATASGRYDRAEDLFGVVAALLALALAWILFQDIRPATGGWASGQTLVLGLLPLLLIVAAGFVLGTVAATLLPVLALPFVTEKEKREEVERAAAEAFYRFRVRKTAAGTGILLYVSLYERMVRVLGDDVISEKLNQKDWDTVRDLVITGIRANRGAEGISQAILKCGELLSRHFPRQPGDVNEIKNELRIID
jgi:putative membrane protein